MNNDVFLKQTSEERLQERDSVHFSQLFFEQPKTNNLKKDLSSTYESSSSTTAVNSTSTTTTETTTTTTATSSNITTSNTDGDLIVTKETSSLSSLSESKNVSENEDNKRNENTSISKNENSQWTVESFHYSRDLKLGAVVFTNGVAAVIRMVMNFAIIFFCTL